MVEIVIVFDLVEPKKGLQVWDVYSPGSEERFQEWYWPKYQGQIL